MATVAYQTRVPDDNAACLLLKRILAGGVAIRVEIEDDRGGNGDIVVRMIVHEIARDLAHKPDAYLNDRHNPSEPRSYDWKVMQ